MAALLSLLNFAGAPQPGDLRIAVNSPDRSNRSQLFTSTWSRKSKSVSKCKFCFKLHQIAKE